MTRKLLQLQPTAMKISASGMVALSQNMQEAYFNKINFISLWVFRISNTACFFLGRGSRFLDSIPLCRCTTGEMLGQAFPQKSGESS